MPGKIKEGKKDKLDLTIVFWVILTLFLISLAFLVKGSLQGLRKQNRIDTSQQKPEGEVKKEEPLSQFFDKEFASDAKKEDKFSVNDPFKEICAQTSGGHLPSISGGTVCLR